MIKVIQRNNDGTWMEKYRYTFALSSQEWRGWRTKRVNGSPDYIFEESVIKDSLINGSAIKIIEVSDGKE